MKSPIPNDENTTMSTPDGLITSSKLRWGEACKAISEKQAKVTKLEWNNPDIYLFLNGETLCIHKANGTINSLIVRYADMIAEDYQIVGYTES